MSFEFRDHQAAALAEMPMHQAMMVTAPTGSGKSVIFMEDSKRHIGAGNVVVFVASRLKLCIQHYNECDQYLKDVDYVDLMVGAHDPIEFRRSKKRVKVQGTFATTITSEIKDRYRIAKKAQLPLYIWSTYDSLNRVMDAEIPVTVVYFDEAHNAVQSDKHAAVKRVAEANINRYFFTATPLMTASGSDKTSGMNNHKVYGSHEFKVDFSEMLAKGYIVEPKLHIQFSNGELNNGESPIADFQAIKETIEYYEDTAPQLHHKVLFCMKGVEAIRALFDKTVINEWASDNGYDILTTDSTNGAFLNGKKIKDFNTTLKQLGDNHEGKLLIFHVAQVSEGIDVRGLTGVSFMRTSVSEVFATQAVGRVVRTALGKTFGFVTVVVHKNDHGELCGLLEKLVYALKTHGVDFDYVLNEIDGKGAEKEEIEPLIKKVAKQIKELELQWTHQFMLDLLIATAEKDEQEGFDAMMDDL